MKDFKKLINENQLQKAFYQAVYGIEKEGVRVKRDAKVALTDHPSILGSRSFHPYIQTDFSESQLELITPPSESIETSRRWLAALHDVTWRSLREDELIWPMSMPAKLPAVDEIQIAKLENAKDVHYRNILTEKYGKKKQMLSGIHYNFQLSEDLLKKLFESQQEERNYRVFRSQLYLKLARNFWRYRWLLTYFLGAAPVADSSFFDEDSTGKLPPQRYVRSIRNSHYGYVNTEEISVSYENLDDYVNDLEQLVTNGLLSEERELYAPVRLRGTKRARDMRTEGIGYLELRVFDLNPFEPFGMSEEAMRFVHLFCLLMIWMEETAAMDETKLGDEMSQVTALEHPHQVTRYAPEGEWLLEQLMEMLEQTEGSQEDRAIVHALKEQLKTPEKTIAGRMVSEIEAVGSFLDFGLKRAEQYRAEATEKPYALRGFTGMELSTQLLIFDAIQQGIEVEVLDEYDQFLKLSYKGHIEYVKNGNMTSKDQYIAPLIMENKTVTKKILSQSGFKVPAGEEYQSVEDAKAAYWRYKNKSIVVKPKSTNYGLGISIFKQSPAKAGFDSAVEFAFKEDVSILIEEFIEGTEYRFFVLEDAVPAVMLRTPANVVGDGNRTVRELVTEKNQDPLRGAHHRSPLEKIQLGEIEQLMLSEQGYTTESVPEKNQIVYLRENSNISTGGDSIDFTDRMDDTYKQVAVQMAQVIGAKVCGIDLIIPDYQKPVTEDQTGYTVIEANFNPAMHMHAFVHQGKGRRLTMGILRMLFPELADIPSL